MKRKQIRAMASATIAATFVATQALAQTTPPTTAPAVDPSEMGRLNHYLSMMNPRPTTQAYLAARAKAQADEAAADARSDEAWARAKPEVDAWAARGKPYIPWASKPGDLPQAGIPAFPGAWGGGMYSFGGRGGRVFVVTSLDDRGPGTLREACEAGGPRIVVFNVAGLLRLKERIRIRAPYITIVGNTAPGDGVCIADEAIEIETHDVVMRHLRVRRGVVEPTRRNDSIGGHAVGNVILDHISASWGSDEVISIYRHVYQEPGGPARKLPTVNVTIQYSTFAEAVNGSQHGLGATIGGHNSTFHHNLFISNMNRNPSVGMDGDFNFVNNVVYNWMGRSIDGGDEKSFYQIINNYFKPGPATPLDNPIRYRILKPEARRSKERNEDFGKAYVAGNVVEGNPAVSADNWAGGVQLGDGYDATKLLPLIRVDEPFRMSPLRPIETAEQAFETVMREFGATLPKRDGHDLRYEQMTRSGSVTRPDLNGLIRSVDDVGGYAEYEAFKGTPYADADGDGMSDEWERASGLNPNDAADAAGDIDGDGYTNIEAFIFGIDSSTAVDWTNLDNNRDTLSKRAAR